MVDVDIAWNMIRIWIVAVLYNILSHVCLCLRVYRLSQPNQTRGNKLDIWLFWRSDSQYQHGARQRNMRQQYNYNSQFVRKSVNFSDPTLTDRQGCWLALFSLVNWKQDVSLYWLKVSSFFMTSKSRFSAPWTELLAFLLGTMKLFGQLFPSVSATALFLPLSVIKGKECTKLTNFILPGQFRFNASSSILLFGLFLWLLMLLSADLSSIWQ